MSNSLSMAAEALRSGRTPVRVTPHGNSMAPRVRSGQTVEVELCDASALKAGDVVLCVVAGVIRLHLVTAVDHVKKRAQISNNHGHVNGWVGYARVYGKMTRVVKD